MDLHRHDEYSSFDGFGKAKELAELAKELGHSALGISNHGNTNGLVQHYMACKEVGIKPILGVEGYFLPVYEEKNRGYHLCLFAKNHKGYRNINEIQFEGEKQKYYNPIWTFDLLKKYHEGVICTSACIASYSSQCIKNGDVKEAARYLTKMKKIFGDDFYIEIQPYKISEEGLQEKVNSVLLKLSKKLDIKCILTSDSHRGRKEDFPTYIKMHEMAGHDIAHIEGTYKERYMPSDKELYKRFVSMHGNRENAEQWDRTLVDGRRMLKNLKEIEDKVDDDIFKDLEQTLPVYSDDSTKLLKSKIRSFLKSHNKLNEKYIKRINDEMHVITSLGFQDYFLIVADYVNWAKENDIAVGPGRGSACNCLVAYCLGITSVDSLLFGLDFRRFLREDKKKMPDIDVDFEKSRRGEVIQYVIDRYKGKTARIASYGLYKLDNLINDLAKVCGLKTDKSIEEEKAYSNKKNIVDIKKLINDYIDEDGNLASKELLMTSKAKIYDRMYDGIITHFTKLYKKVRFIGTHAAGVAVTGGNILDYTSLRIAKDGSIYTNYDLNDMENIHVIKFDMLGLQTMEEIHELRDMTNAVVDYDTVVKDPKVIEQFSKGETECIFQFDKKSVRDILVGISCDCFNDIVAANAMNRPGPLSLKMPEAYAENKMNLAEAKHSKYYKYTKESYGTIIYQEQIQQICVYVGNMSWGDADKVMKMIGGQSQSEDARAEFEKTKKEMHDKFVTGAVENGYSKREAEEIFNMVLVYSFNKGHATGYSLISMEEMFYKVYYPEAFWAAKLRNCPKENYEKYKTQAVQAGSIILLPHINGGAKFSLVKKFGSVCLQEGMCNIDFVGEKVAVEIEEERRRNGKYKSYADLVERVPKRLLNNRVLNALENAGAIEFNKDKYLSRVEQYNRAIFGKNW